LDDDIATLARSRFGVVVSLLQPGEQVELGLEREGEACARYNIDFRSLPVADRCAPGETAEFIESVHQLAILLRHGANVAIHCRQSIGRAGLLAVSLALSLGVPLEAGLAIVSRARGLRVPETQEQERWLRSNAAHLSALRSDD